MAKKRVKRKKLLESIDPTMDSSVKQKMVKSRVVRVKKKGIILTTNKGEAIGTIVCAKDENGEKFILNLCNEVGSKPQTIVVPRLFSKTK
jgi:hypothetical protein